MHSRPGRVGDDYIRTPVLIDEILCQDILHVSGKEQGVLYSIDLGIHFCIFYGLFNYFNSINLFYKF